MNVGGSDLCQINLYPIIILLPSRGADESNSSCMVSTNLAVCNYIAGSIGHDYKNDKLQLLLTHTTFTYESRYTVALLLIYTADVPLLCAMKE